MRSATYVTEATFVHNARTTMYIIEAGGYRVRFRSKAPLVEEFTAYVCSEVLPLTRKYGHYMSNEEALIQPRSSRGESAFHFRVREHIETKRYLKSSYAHRLARIRKHCL